MRTLFFCIPASAESAASRTLAKRKEIEMSFLKQGMKFCAGAGLLASGVASAAVPVAVDTAITSMATDAAAVGAAVLVAVIGVVAIKFIRKGL